jgi:hypothetical protein
LHHNVLFPFKIADQAACQVASSAVCIAIFLVQLFQLAQLRQSTVLPRCFASTPTAKSLTSGHHTENSQASVGRGAGAYVKSTPTPRSEYVLNWAANTPFYQRRLVLHLGGTPEMLRAPTRVPRTCNEKRPARARRWMIHCLPSYTSLFSTILNARAGHHAYMMFSFHMNADRKRRSNRQL